MAAAGNEGKPTTETPIGLEEFRRSLTEVGDRAWDGERFVVSRHERERFVVIGFRDYEQLRALEKRKAPTALAASAG